MTQPPPPPPPQSQAIQQPPPPSHGGQPQLQQPPMQTPWLPPWVATQATQGGPPGSHIPLAATQFQWQATHPSTTGGYVTSWGGYSLAPNTVLQTNHFGMPMVQPPPQQYSLQMQPGNLQQPAADQPPPAAHTPLLPHAQVHQQPPPQQQHQWPQQLPQSQPPPQVTQPTTQPYQPYQQQGGLPPPAQTCAATTRAYHGIHHVRFPRAYDPDADPWHPNESPRESTTPQATSARGNQQQLRDNPPLGHDERGGCRTATPVLHRAILTPPAKPESSCRNTITHQQQQRGRAWTPTTAPADPGRNTPHSDSRADDARAHTQCMGR